MMRAQLYSSLRGKPSIISESAIRVSNLKRFFVRAAEAPHINARSDYVMSEDEELALKLRQVTANARTLVRARRPEDAEKVIDEGLEMFPWQASLWFWKLATKVGDSKGAIETWDTMTRMGVQKLPEHFDIMATAVCHVEARHVVIELFYELLEQDYIGNPKFYSQFFIACADPQGVLYAKGMTAYQEMLKRPELAAILADEGVNSALMRLRAGETTNARKQVRLQSDESSSTTIQNSMSDTTLAKHRFEMQLSHQENTIAQEEEKTLSSPNLLQEKPTTDSTLAIHDQPINNTQIDLLTVPELARSITTQIVPPVTSSVLTGFNTVTPVPDSQQSSAYEIRSKLEPFFRGRRQEGRAHAAALHEARQLLKSSDVSLETYNYVLRNAALLESPESLEQLLEDAIDKGHRPDATTYNPILRSYFQSGRPDDALDIVERMELSNVKFNYQNILEILRGLMQTDRIDEALEFFVDVFKDGSDLTIIPGKDGEIKCFATVIEGLCRADRFADATNLVAVMIQRGLSPNLIIYTDLVRMCFTKDLVIEAMKYFDMAVKIPSQARLNIRWKQDLDDLVATVVGGFLDADRYEEAEKFMSQASTQGYWHSTNVKPWTHFIDWLARHNRVDDAYNLFSFHNRKSSPAVHKYQLFSTMLQSVYLDTGDVHGGLQWFTKMQHECEYFEQHPYQALISAAMINGERAIGERMWSLAKDYLEASGERATKSLENTAKRWDLLL